jgi:hypothetical protein
MKYEIVLANAESFRILNETAVAQIINTLPLKLTKS